MDDFIKILSIPIVGNFIKSLISPFTKEKFKRLPNVEEMKLVLDNTGKKFKEKFVIPNTEESYFYRQTGIATNHKSIPQYCDLKNRLGRNFTWENIRKAKPYLLFEEKKITVKVSKIDKYLTNILSIVLLGLLVLLFMFIISLSEVSWGKDFINMILLIMCILLIIFVLVRVITPVMIAINIKKILNNQENSGKNTL